METSPTRRIPRKLFTTALVVEAYRGVIKYRAVLRTLHRIGAMGERPKVGPTKVDPDVLRFYLPTIYHRCVELALEKRHNK